MTNELILAIKQAEEQAQLQKQGAILSAEKMVDEAVRECVRLEQTTVEVCKAYTATAKKQAEETAQKEYNDCIAKQTEEAKVYCAKILSNAETLATKIVGRITRGDC